MVEGAESGVLVMLAVTYALLIGCAGLSAMWFVKARRRVAAAGQSDPSES
jgi:hypothetical protein